MWSGLIILMEFPKQAHHLAGSHGRASFLFNSDMTTASILFQNSSSAATPHFGDRVTFAKIHSVSNTELGATRTNAPLLKERTRNAKVSFTKALTHLDCTWLCRYRNWTHLRQRKGSTRINWPNLKQPGSRETRSPQWISSAAGRTRWAIHFPRRPRRKWLCTPLNTRPKCEHSHRRNPAVGCFTSCSALARVPSKKKK